MTAFDISEQGLSKARELANCCGVKIDFFKADVRNFRLETNYDIIFSNNNDTMIGGSYMNIHTVRKDEAE